MPFSKGATSPLTFPLTSIPAESDGLQSPVIGVDHATQYGLLLVQDDSPEMAESLADLWRVRQEAKNGEWSGWFLEKHWPGDASDNPGMLADPMRFAGLSERRPQQYANAVHMDDAMEFPLYVLKWLNGTGVPCKNELGNGHGGFVQRHMDPSTSMATHQGSTIALVWESKWFHGATRPEEAAGFNMTAYPEGCPKHPAFPAGHGGNASAPVVLKDHFDFTNHQDEWKQILLACYQWAMARSFAGVHHGVDNVSGLMHGGWRHDLGS